MSSDVWRIRRYDALDCVWETKIPAHRVSEAALEQMLKRLVSQTLDPDEIVDASLNHRKGGPIATSLLEVRRSHNAEKQRIEYYCGTNPHVVAIYERAIA